MVLDLLLLGLGITLEPFPLIAFLLILSAARGPRKGLGFILGWLACLVAVILAVAGLTGGNPPPPAAAPSTAVLALKLALGVALICVALRRWRRRGAPRQPPGWMARLDRLSPWTAAGLAAFLQPWTLVAAAAATLTQAKLSSTADYLALLAFCLVSTSSFLYLELSVVLRPASAQPQITALRGWLDEHRDQVVILIFLLLGFWLAGKSIYLLVS